MKKNLLTAICIMGIATASAFALNSNTTTKTQTQFYTWTITTTVTTQGNCTFTYEIRTKYFLGKPIFTEKKVISVSCGDSQGGGNN